MAEVMWRASPPRKKSFLVVLDGQSDLIWKGRSRRFIRRRREGHVDGVHFEGEDDVLNVAEGRLVAVRVA